MDGTLVDSTAGVVGAWETFREAYPDIDVQSILSCEPGLNQSLITIFIPSSCPRCSHRRQPEELLWHTGPRGA